MSELSNLDRNMLQIKSLDRDACLNYSEFTQKWYVSADIELGDGFILSGITEHCSLPELAVAAYFRVLTTVDSDHFLVTHSTRETRRHWRWNGAAFAEIPRG